MTNTINLTLITTLLVLLVLGCGGSNRETTTSANSTGNVNSNAAPAIAIDSKTLTKEYDTNELAADAKYKGKMLIVTGKLSNISETMGRVTAQLEGHNTVVTAMCHFEEGEKTSVAKLKKGEKATFVGMNEGSTAGLYVSLDKCKIQ